MKLSASRLGLQSPMRVNPIDLTDLLDYLSRFTRRKTTLATPRTPYLTSSNSSASVAETVVLHAFKTGYRHIDSARAYRNEQPCADAIRSSTHSIPRSEIFFTSKVPPRAMGYKATEVSSPSSHAIPITSFLLLPPSFRNPSPHLSPKQTSPT